MFSLLVNSHDGNNETALGVLTHRNGELSKFVVKPGNSQQPDQQPQCSHFFGSEFRGIGIGTFMFEIWTKYICCGEARLVCDDQSVRYFEDRGCERSGVSDGLITMALSKEPNATVTPCVSFFEFNGNATCSFRG